MRYFFVVLVAVCFLSCGEDKIIKTNPISPVIGEELGACYPNGTCNEGLECIYDVCIKPTSNDSDSDEIKTDESDIEQTDKDVDPIINDSDDTIIPDDDYINPYPDEEPFPDVEVDDSDIYEPLQLGDDCGKSAGYSCHNPELYCGRYYDDDNRVWFYECVPRFFSVITGYCASMIDGDWTRVESRWIAANDMPYSIRGDTLVTKYYSDYKTFRAFGFDIWQYDNNPKTTDATYCEQLKLRYYYVQDRSCDRIANGYLAYNNSDDYARAVIPFEIETIMDRTLTESPHSHFPEFEDGCYWIYNTDDSVKKYYDTYTKEVVTVYDPTDTKECHVLCIVDESINIQYGDDDIYDTSNF